MDGDDDDDFDDDEDDNFDRDDDVVVIISHVLFWRIGQTEVLIQNPNFDSFFSILFPLPHNLSRS